MRSSSFFDLVRLPSMQQQLKHGGLRICGINGISMVPFPGLLSMFDAVVDGFDVVSFNSMFIGFSSIQKDIKRYQEHFTPETFRFT